MSIRQEKAVVSVVLLALLHPTFQWVGSLASVQSSPPPWWIATRLDRELTVVPEAAWIYVSWYPAAAMGLFAGRDALRRIYVAYLAAFGICVAFYVLLPLSIERPPLSTSSSSFSVVLLQAVYAADRPVNLFPSFHAAVAGVLCHLRPRRRWLRAVLITWMAAICVSCVLTKQHYVADVVAGLLVGSVSVRAVSAMRKRIDTEAVLARLSRSLAGFGSVEHQRLLVRSAEEAENG